MSIDIVSVGAWTAFDRIVRLDGELTDGTTVSTLPSPDPDETFYGDCSINVAAVAASLGATTGLVSVVGEDFVSSGYRDHLETLGVDVSGVVIRPGATSGHSLNISTPGGSTYCISRLDAALFQDEYDPPNDLITQARWVVINEAFSGYTLRIARLAEDAGIPVALNGMVATGGPLAVEFLRIADVMVTNRSEAMALESQVGQDHLPARRIVTIGSGGARIVDGSDTWSVAPVVGNGVVDTTGAGDSFTAGTVVGLLRGLTLLRAAEIGSAAASYVIEEIGCQTKLPTWDGIQQRLKEQE